METLRGFQVRVCDPTNISKVCNSHYTVPMRDEQNMWTSEGICNSSEKITYELHNLC